MNEPTIDDLQRDLKSDLKYVNTYGMVTVNHVTPWSAALRRALAAEAEVARLQKIVEGLTDRVAAQSELLSRKAEGAITPSGEIVRAQTPRRRSHGRTRSEVIEARKRAISGGCCDRFADHSGCDCLETALPDEEKGAAS